MSFTIAIGAPLNHSLRKTGGRQLAGAAETLRAAGAKAESIHQARKSFKRFRALLYLIKPSMAAGAFVSFNGRIKDISRRFALARDAQAMLETAMLVEAEAPEPGCRRVAKAVRPLLHEAREAGAGGLDAGAFESALGALDDLRRDFKALPVKIESFGALSKSLAKVYHRARKEMPLAYAAGSDEGFHDWRKSVQRHWRHLQLMAPLWPGLLRQQAALARDVSQMLGDDHDLTVLQAYVQRHRAALGANAEIESFARCCALRQEELRRQAHAAGRRLFAERPKHLARRLAIYWETAEILNEAKVRPQKNEARPAGIQLPA